MRSSALQQGPRLLVFRRSVQLDERKELWQSTCLCGSSGRHWRVDFLSPFGQHYNSVLSENMAPYNLRNFIPYQRRLSFPAVQAALFGFRIIWETYGMFWRTKVWVKTSFVSELVPHLIESVQFASISVPEITHIPTNESSGSNVGRHKVLESLHCPLWLRVP